MTNTGIDEILNRLSIKFNRIFYDRDLVECVSEDLQTIINNKNKCWWVIYFNTIKLANLLCMIMSITPKCNNVKSYIYFSIYS